MTPATLAGAIVILLFSIILHEVMHGLAALFFGDRTAKLAGRLTLNPLPHIDPIGSILLPAMGLFSGYLLGVSSPIFGWAKPVPVNPLHFSNIRLGELSVALAGVSANLAIAAVAAGLFHLFDQTLLFPEFAKLMSIAVSMNLLLAFFNLLPIPPLDGSKVLMVFLPPQLAAQYRSLERYGFLILMIILFTPLGNFVWGIMRIFINLGHQLLGI